MKKITDRTKYLYHVTHENNWLPIALGGIDHTLSNGRRQAVWLVTRSKILWAAKHISSRDGLPLDELIVVKVSVRRRNLRKNKVRGAWYHPGSIHAHKIEIISRIDGMQI